MLIIRLTIQTKDNIFNVLNIDKIKKEQSYADYSFLYI